MKKASFILLLLLAAGCGGSLKNKWTNFSAYYNTFYNAKKDFHEGLNKVEEQPIELDPDALVRPHPKPVLAGSESFNEAIENGAQILRRFPESKWTDNALLLIGRSYYYLQEDFLAIQKFEELLALPSDTPLKQQAVIWKGRTLLDIEAYTRGIQFLQGALTDFADSWKPQNKAEAQIVLAEHFAMLERWQDATQMLEPAILNIDDRALQGRSYLLLGQLFQKQGDYIRAFHAYSNVRKNYPDYEYIYLADERKAEVSRLAGNMQQAISIYKDMLNDDKNYERRNELNYHLAQTYEAEGNYQKAEALYHEILKNKTEQNFQAISGDVYYHLGQIYSRRYNNYELAAAYFDTASQVSQQQQAPTDAEKLSSAYSRYVSLKNEIVRIDSLLQLGSLSDEELENQLVKIRRERKELLQNSQNTVQEKNNLLTNADREDVYKSTESAANAASSNFGFLNYKNPQIVQQARRQFDAIWDSRPLADNWRRREALSGSSISDAADSTQNVTENISKDENFSDDQLGIKIQEIPRTESAKEKLRQERVRTEYRLGSLFFLTLDQPDSAAFHYRNILQESASSLKAQTLYSLFELYDLQKKTDSAAVYRQEILQQYPNSRFAERILSDSTGVSTIPNSQTDSSADLRAKARKILSQPDSLTSEKAVADFLRSLAIENENSPDAPAIYLQSIRKYIEWAKKHDPLPPDSLNPVGINYWNEVRNVLQNFKKRFPNAPQQSQIDTWLDTINHPEELQAIASCKELGVEPVIVNGKQQFVDSVTLPDNVKKMNLSGAIRYRFVIAKDGRVESFSLRSNPTNLGIEKAYERAIKDHLRFEPITQNGAPVRAACKMEFPIEN